MTSTRWSPRARRPRCDRSSGPATPWSARRALRPPLSLLAGAGRPRLPDRPGRPHHGLDPVPRPGMAGSAAAPGGRRADPALGLRARVLPAAVSPPGRRGNACVLYPLAAHLPAIRRGPGRDDGRLRIGCLGRIADDKNVTAAFELLREVQKARPRNCTWPERSIRGAPNSPAPADIPAFAARLGLAPDSVIYHGDLPYQAIWRFLGELDVLYFPAVSSNESFGRVLLEAGRAGVPSSPPTMPRRPNWCPAGNLVPVTYRNCPDAHHPAGVAGRARHDCCTGDSRRPRRSRRPLRRTALLRRRLPRPRARRPGAVHCGAVHAERGGRRFLRRTAHLGSYPAWIVAKRSHFAPSNCASCAPSTTRRLPARLGALARLLPHLPGNPTLQRVARERLPGSAPSASCGMASPAPGRWASTRGSRWRQRAAECRVKPPSASSSPSTAWSCPRLQRLLDSLAQQDYPGRLSSSWWTTTSNRWSRPPPSWPAAPRAGTRLLRGAQRRAPRSHGRDHRLHRQRLRVHAPLAVPGVAELLRDPGRRRGRRRRAATDGGSGGPSLTERYDAFFHMRQAHYVTHMGFAATANCLTRRALFDELGPFDTRFRSGGDRPGAARCWKPATAWPTAPKRRCSTTRAGWMGSC